MPLKRGLARSITQPLILRSFLVSCCLLMISSACKREGSPTSGAARDRSAALLVLQRRPGYPGPRDPVVSGIVAKIWHDGLLLRSTDPDQPSSTFQLGTVPDEQFALLLREIDEIMRTAPKDGDPSVTVDAAALVMTIERGNSRLILAESFPLERNTSLVRIRDHIFRLELNNVREVNDPDSIK